MAVTRGTEMDAPTVGAREPAGGASLAEQVDAVRRRVGMFELQGRGIIAVSGGDRVRWLNGMISNDVASLAPGVTRSGCYATLLTRKGSIIADLHVLDLGEEIWLESAAHGIPEILAELDKYIIADDVTLSDIGARWAEVSLEGPLSRSVLDDVLGASPDLAPECGVEARHGDHRLVVAAFGTSGERAYRIFLPAGADDVVARLTRAVETQGGLACGWRALEVLRIEAGVPRLEADLRNVLPAEARIDDRAISYSKGCYVGQEIVARVHARGQVNHLLVGLVLSGWSEGGRAAPLPESGTPLHAGEKRVGEITSVCRSPRLGPIALGYVRREQAVPDVELTAAGGSVRVVSLPFLELGKSSGPERP